MSSLSWRGVLGLREAVLTMLMSCAFPLHAAAQCSEPLADVNQDLTTNVVDVQCGILTTLWALGGEVPEEVPSCSALDPTRADVNCEEGVNVADVLLVIKTALGEPLSPTLDTDGSGCPDACEAFEPPVVCGNGVIEEGEECDDGLLNSDIAPDICRSDCTNPACGDGVQDTGEQCDLGTSNSDSEPDTCRTSCFLPFCGDGVVDATEECEVGMQDCTAECTTVLGGEGVCGNGIEEPGEECDEGVNNSDVLPDSCRTTCVAPSCGDLVIDSDEACDNGPLNSDSVPDACRTSCVVASCGDTVVDSGESCDNGLLNSDIEPDACRSNCALAGCGDGVVDAGEFCDDGPDNSDTLPDACRTTCVKASCGDGVTDTFEECDGDEGCGVNCLLELATCGNGVVEPPEQCDGGPDCDAFCQLILSSIPIPGDLVITEIYVQGSGGEQWFEVLNVTASDLELGGVQIGDGSGNLFSVPAGTLLSAGGVSVFGNAPAAALAPQVPVDVVFSGVQFGQGAGEIVLVLAGEQLDRVTYSAATGFPLSGGASMNLAPEATSVADNDGSASWCSSVFDTGAGFAGTPGVQNPPCPDCGNGQVEPGEECEPSLSLPTDYCQDDCTFGTAPECGNGVLEEGEQCDNGELNSNSVPDACRTDCTEAYCGDLVVDTGEECDNFLGCSETCTIPAAAGVNPGDLVITEFMPESALLEGTGNWFELTNTTTNTIDLSDLIVFDQGTDYVEFAFFAPPSIGPGEYLVLGTNPNPETNGGVQVDVELPGMILEEGADEIILVHTIEIDRVEWSEEAPIPLVQGYSVSLTPGVLTAIGNDDSSAWCTGLGIFGPGGQGTPGEANGGCPVCGDGIQEGAEECDEGSGINGPFPDTCRDTCVLPACGDGIVDSGESCDGVGCAADCTSAPEPTGSLVVTEVMITPGYAEDAPGEWFELTNTTAVTLNLAGMVVRDEGGETFQIPEDGDLSITPGQHVLFGKSDDPQFNGGIAPDYVYEGMAFDPAGDEIIVEFEGIEVDRVEWTAAYPIQAGYSLSLSASATDSLENDDVFSWCLGLIQFGAGEYGTPGSPNVACSECGNGIFELGEECDLGFENSDTEPDACRTDCTLPGCGDGVVDDGEECDGNAEVCSTECIFVVDVKPGELVVTEIMNNPSGFSDVEGEWFEVLNVTSEPLNVDGLWLVDDGTDFHVVDAGGDLFIAPGAYFVFGSNGDFVTNGGVVVDYAYDPAQFILSNGDDEVVLSSLGVEVDRVAYDGGVSFPDEAGSSLSLDGNILDDASNDAGENWCVSSTLYGVENFGTPGSANGACPECGNGEQEPGEECDDGNLNPFDGCEVDCTLTVYDVCGNGIVEQGEECDFGAGNSDTVPDACRTTCQLAGCGDGVTDSGEECDGGEFCSPLCAVEGGLNPGDLVISEIMLYPLTSNPLQGRWFEVYNPTSGNLSLTGVVLTDDGGQEETVQGALSIPAGGFVVLGSNGDVQTNGGVILDYELSTFTLDEEDEIVLSFGGLEIDRVNYSAFGGFIFPQGASLLCDLSYADAFINDFGSVWCSSSSSYGSGGLGTPGAYNDACPVCGDGVISGNEECDDENSLSGDGCSFDCTLEGDLPGPGDLVIAEIMNNPKQVNDADGEWFEVVNASGEDINLQDIRIRNEQNAEFVVSSSMLMNPGDRIVFGVNASPGANGGISLTFEASTLALGDTSGSLTIENPLGVLVDQVIWASNWTLTEGAAMNLHPELEDATSNDSATSWCLALDALASGDFGTPGQANPPCPF